MFRTILAVSFLASAAASAEIYRWVDAAGRTQYSDRPVAGAEIVGRSGARQGTAAGESAGTQIPPEGLLLGTYSAFEIVAPEANQTLRQESGDVAVSMVIDPPLGEGHRMELVLDGLPISAENAGAQLMLNGVGHGSHRIYAQIRDPSGGVVARSATLDFHLRKPLPPGVLQ